MAVADLLDRLVRSLDEAQIPHMLVGSFASSVHGEPRSTRGIDLVIDPDESSMRGWLATLDEGSMYVGDGLRVLRDRDQFNVIDLESGWKIDLVIRRERAFSRTEFDRRRPARILDTDVFVASAEDTVLAKLEWASGSGSSRQVDDVVGVLAASGDELDMTYLRSWADDLDVVDELEVALSRAAQV